MIMRTHLPGSFDLRQDMFGDPFDDAGQVPIGRLLDELRPEHPHMRFVQTNLISDGFVPAQQVDPNLINPWGVSHSPTSPFWISENNAGVASIDTVSGGSVTLNAIPPVTIAVPPGQTPGTATPTGQVFNSFQSTGAFMLSDGAPATFLFATED